MCTPCRVILLQDSSGKISTKNQTSYSYGARYDTNPIPKFHISSKVWNETLLYFTKYTWTRFQGISAETAYRIIHDELTLGEYCVAHSQHMPTNVFKTGLLYSIWHHLYTHGCLPRQTCLCVRISPRTWLVLYVFFFSCSKLFELTLHVFRFRWVSGHSYVSFWLAI